MSISWVCSQSNMGVPFQSSVSSNEQRDTLSVFFWVSSFSLLEDAENDPKGHLLQEERRREEIHQGLHC